MFNFDYKLFWSESIKNPCCIGGKFNIKIKLLSIVLPNKLNKGSKFNALECNGYLLMLPPLRL